jgi:hypothetical protein
MCIEQENSLRQLAHVFARFNLLYAEAPFAGVRCTSWDPCWLVIFMQLLQWHTQ